MRMSDWSSDVWSSDLQGRRVGQGVLQSEVVPLDAAGTAGPPAGQLARPGAHGGHADGLVDAGAAPVVVVVDVVGVVGGRRQGLGGGPLGGIADRLRAAVRLVPQQVRSEEHTSELQSLMRISAAVCCLNKKKHT